MKKEEMTQQKMRKWKTRYQLSRVANNIQIMKDETNIQEKVLQIKRWTDKTLQNQTTKKYNSSMWNVVRQNTRKHNQIEQCVR